MIILGIDSSTEILAVGLVEKERIINETTVMSQREHASRIFNTIEEILLSSNITKRDLSGIGVAIGPGSFTGLRVGLAVAKGMSISLRIPVVGISTFEVIHHRLRSHFPRHCLIAPVRKGEFYLLKHETEFKFPESIELVDFTDLSGKVGNLPWSIIGQVKDQLNLPSDNMIPVEMAKISGGELALLGAKIIASGQHDNVDTLEPLYLALSQAERKYDRRRHKNP
jgi:tRNA threonylcarbamoyladenosine biosynthesis protein TsaB